MVSFYRTPSTKLTSGNFRQHLWLVARDSDLNIEKERDTHTGTHDTHTHTHTHTHTQHTHTGGPVEMLKSLLAAESYVSNHCRVDFCKNSPTCMFVCVHVCVFGWACPRSTWNDQGTTRASCKPRHSNWIPRYRFRRFRISARCICSDVTPVSAEWHWFCAIDSFTVETVWREGGRGEWEISVQMDIHPPNRTKKPKTSLFYFFELSLLNTNHRSTHTHTLSHMWDTHEQNENMHTSAYVHESWHVCLFWREGANTLQKE